jgi:hypothetical protein
MTHETAFKQLSKLWEKMQTARKPETIVNKALAIITVYMSENEFIPDHVWSLIDFFQHAETVLIYKKVPVTQKEVTQ